MSRFTAHMHLFKNGNMLFAYDYIKNVLIKVDSYVHNALSDILNADEPSSQIERALNTIPQIELYRKMGFFFYIEDCNTDTSNEYSSKTAFISFPTTHMCNLRCKYCFAEHGENYKGSDKKLSKSLIKDIMEFVYLDYFKDSSRIRLDFVSGGEPLLNFDLVKDAVEISEKLYTITKTPIDIFLCTNGTINDPEIWDYINKYNINLGISLDGPQQLHDIARVYEDGRGGYSDTVNTIEYIINSANYSPHTKSVWILSVITGKTKSILDILNHNKALGIKSMQMKLARLDKNSEFSIGRDFIDKILNMYKELVTHFVSSSMAHNYEDLSMILNETDYFGKLIYRILYGGRIKRCHAGERKFSFAGNGDIYPCDSFVGNDKFRLGNIYTGVDEEIRKIFVDGTIFAREKCSSCWARFICSGDCYHNSYLINGNIHEPDQVFCDLNRQLIESALYLYHVIKSNGDLEKLKKIVRIKRRFNN